MGYLGVIVFLGIIFLFLFVFTVKQQTAVVIERFGKFNSIRNPGLQFKIPIIKSSKLKFMMHFTN
mgnify:CR=1 FL=1